MNSALLARVEFANRNARILHQPHCDSTRFLDPPVWTARQRVSASSLTDSHLPLSSPTQAVTTPTSIADRFWEQVGQRPDNLALIYKAVERDSTLSDTVTLRELTWRQIALRVSTACVHLEQAGVLPEQVIASWLPNGLPWIVLDLACQSLGIVHAAIDYREPATARNRLVDLVDARGLIVANGSSEQVLFSPSHEAATQETWDLDVEQASFEPPTILETLADSTAQILFTSGSTGQSKAVRLSHRGLVCNALSKLDAAPQHADDRRLNILPFAHAYARTCELSTWIVSGSILALSRDWNELVAMAGTVKPTLINCVPLLASRIADLLEQDEQALGGQLRLLQVGGAALAARLWTRLNKLGLPPLCGYGLTEAGPVICSNRAGRQTANTVGPPVAGVDVRTDADGQLWARGTGMMQGYVRSEVAESFDEVFDCDGWLATGDLATIRSDGQLVIFGRKSHQLTLSSGYMVDPALIESRMLLSGLYSHCLVTLDTAESGLVAWVQLSESAATKKQVESLPLQSPFGDFSDLPRYCLPREVREFPFRIDATNRQFLTPKGTLRRAKILQAIAPDLEQQP